MKYFVFTLAFFLFLAPIHSSTQANENDLLNMYQGYAADTNSDLSTAHRSIRELGDWLSTITANALIFTPGTASQKLIKLKPFFSEKGYKAYFAFLGQQSFAQNLQRDQLMLNTIVNTTPLLIGQGASAGRYAWAFELPVVMSAGTANNVTDTNATLRIQIGRSKNGPEPHGILIESWQIFEDKTETAPKE